MRLIPRKQLWIDPNVQGAVLARVVAYWAFCIIVVAQILLAWQIYNGPPGPFLSHFRYDLIWQEHGIVVIATIALLPFLLFDALSFSNRVAGPLYRMRRSMRQLAAGETVRPIRFRTHDHWPELADEFNVLAAYVEKLRQQAANSAARPTNPTEESELEPATH